jgi:hypothetical protein
VFIEQLKLSSFKGFSEFTLNLWPFTCMVGLNSKGKTSVLQAIGLLHDILVFAFGNRERPDFGQPYWEADPSYGLRRLSFGDPDAVWLHKRTSEPCRISATFSGQVEATIEIMGRNRYKLDVILAGNSIKRGLDQQANRKIIEDIFALRPTYVPPVGAVSPSEYFIAHPQMKEMLDGGRLSECWRSNLYWLWNDGNKASFDEIVRLVQQYLPDAKIQPPRMTHDNPPRVLAEFEEEGTIFDVSASGAGMRTVLNLATILRFSRSECILCDEPDSHLHPTLQRAVARMLMDFSEENNRQVLVATHAPDFIAEVPAKAIVWIDRTQKEGTRCDAVGAVLADLGAISKADAVRAYGADKILFVEGSVDCGILGRLIGLAGAKSPFDDQTVLVAKLPSGKGTATHLSMFRSLLRETFKVDVSVACVTDNDYEFGERVGSEDQQPGEPLLCSIGCKEVENYLLDPAAIASALEVAAKRRKERMGKDVKLPTADAIKSKIAEVIEDPEVLNVLKYQIIPQYRNSLPRTLDTSTKERMADEWFRDKWADEKWRIRNCPGKQVLKRVRDWCQGEFGLTLTPKMLIEALSTCPSDIADIAGKLNAHFYGQTQRMSDH